ncbi:hypothetical protein FOL47_010358 [Perkinsus chesapeaki]|uniref:Cilia- and flagella-associated protein 263 n=1 Tax=Perkinsus chesapeaki TaxID=330153 RepID=A0A7J6N1P5_PERCH|nr:hypothetical protein FOL47_010358 [Perkinsus chesapeaki]
MLSQQTSVGVAATATTVAAAAVGLFLYTRRTSSEGSKAVEEERLARIDKLIVYPVKSAAGINVDSCELTRKGLKYDRIYCIVVPSNDKDKEIIGDYRVLTQRENAKLSLIHPSMPTEEGVTLTFREGCGHDTIHVPLLHDRQRISSILWGIKAVGMDQGDDVAEWLSRCLGEPGARLIKSVGEDEYLRPFPEKDGGIEGDAIELSDGFPVLVLSRASSSSFLSRVPIDVGRSMDYRRFRTNILLDGCAPFTEDKYATLRFEQHPDCWLDLARPCNRCTIPSVDPDTGVMDKKTKEPFPTLMTYRRGGLVVDSCHPRHTPFLSAHKRRVFIGVNAIARFVDPTTFPVLHVGDTLPSLQNELIGVEAELLAGYLHRKGASAKAVRKTLSLDEKYEIAQDEMRAVKDEIVQSSKRGDHNLEILKALMEETDIRAAEVKRDAFEFRRDIVVGAENPRTGKTIAERVLRHFEDKLTQKDMLLSKLTAKNQAMKVAIRKAEGQLREKEQGGDGLQYIDFHKLQIENQQFVSKIEEANKELVDLKKTHAKVTKQVNGMKNRIGDLLGEEAVLKEEIEKRKCMLSKAEQDIIRVVAEKDKARKENDKIRIQSRNLANAGNGSPEGDSDGPQFMECLLLKVEEQNLEKKKKDLERKVRARLLSTRYFADSSRSPKEGSELVSDETSYEKSC